MMKRKRVFFVLAAVFILSLIGWRMWPRTFRAITDSKSEDVPQISIQVSEMGISDGAPVVKLYDLVLDDSEEESAAAVMAILEGTRYRSDFRNMIPWKSSSLGSDSGNSNRSAIVTLTWENGTVCTFFFPDNRLAGLSKDQQNGFRRYHPTDRATLDQITAFAIEHGTLQK